MSIQKASRYTSCCGFSSLGKLESVDPIKKRPGGTNNCTMLSASVRRILPIPNVGVGVAVAVGRGVGVHVGVLVGDGVFVFVGAAGGVSVAVGVSVGSGVLVSVGTAVVGTAVGKGAGSVSVGFAATIGPTGGKNARIAMTATRTPARAMASATDSLLLFATS